MTEYLYIEDIDGLPRHLQEYGPVWLASEAYEVIGNDSPDILATAKSAKLTFNLEDSRGHYLRADWLYEAADILEAIQLDTDTYHLDQPENFKLRDKVDAYKDTANDAWARYHAHNDLAPDAYMAEDYGTDCDDDCGCEWIGDTVDEVEMLLSNFGYVTEWGDGVRTFRVTEDTETNK